MNGLITLCWLILLASHEQTIAFSSQRLNPTSRTISHLSTPTLSPSNCLSIQPSRGRLFHLHVLQHPVNAENDHTNTFLEEEQVPTTLPGAIRRFFFGKECGPLLIAVSLAATLIWRFQIGFQASTLGFDLSVFMSMVIFWWFQEHEMHLHLLHSKFDWMGKRIHEEHHEKPYFHISIDPAGLMIGWLAAVHILFRCILPLPLAVSATLGYGLSGLWYEWAHYIVHTKVRPRHAFWKQMRNHHIHHHLVDDRYWLGFSVPAIDNLFGTNPTIQQVKKEQKASK